MTTTSTYLSIESNLAHYQAMTAAEPQVKTATQYYQKNIGNVTSIKQFVSNYRLLSYALQAYGLGNQVNNTALITKVLEEGTTSSKALANTLTNPAWKKFAQAFDFTATGSSAPSSSASVKTTTSDYVEQQLEATEGESDPGVQLALYFQRVAPTITSSYGILGDANLLQTVQTIFGLAPTTSAGEIDKEAAAVNKLVPLSTLQNPAKLQSLVERFTAAYDADYGPASADPSGLTVTNGNTASTTAGTGAESVLTGIVNGNASHLYGLVPTDAISAGVLSSVQGLALGG